MGYNFIGFLGAYIAINLLITFWMQLRILRLIIIKYYKKIHNKCKYYNKNKQVV